MIRINLFLFILFCSFLSNRIASFEVVNQDDFEIILFDKINITRQELGLPTLTTNTILMQVSEAHCVDMASRKYFAHESPEGDHAGQRLDLAKYKWSYWGEVLARGSLTPEETLQGWMNSPPHKAILIDGNYQEIGIGFTEDFCWTAVLTIPR